MSEYQPGVCNINQKGIEYRQNVANIAGVVGFLLLFAPVYFGVGGLILSLIGVPVMFIAVLNYLQAKNSFCVSHGMGGTQQAADGANNAENVTDEQAVISDKMRSKSMLKKAALTTFVISVSIVAMALVITAATTEIAF